MLLLSAMSGRGGALLHVLGLCQALPNNLGIARVTTWDNAATALAAVLLIQTLFHIDIFDFFNVYSQYLQIVPVANKLLRVLLVVICVCYSTVFVLHIHTEGAEGRCTSSCSSHVEEGVTQPV